MRRPMEKGHVDKRLWVPAVGKETMKVLLPERQALAIQDGAWLGALHLLLRGARKRGPTETHRPTPYSPRPKASVLEESHFS